MKKLAPLRKHFRDRLAEWVLSGIMFFWGLSVASNPNLFMIDPRFHALLKIAEQEIWALLAIFIGLLRLVLLVINGLWRPSSHLRAVGAALGSVLWGSLITSYLSLQDMSPTVYVFSGLLLIETCSLWFAAGDAKIADLQARKT